MGDQCVYRLWQWVPPILYIIAQIIAYSNSKKFFHDQLSNTLLGNGCRRRPDNDKNEIIF